MSAGPNYCIKYLNLYYLMVREGLWTVSIRLSIRVIALSARVAETGNACAWN